MSSRGNLRKLSSVVSFKGRKNALEKFLDVDCKSGKIDLSEAEFFFKHMLDMTPSRPISCFSKLLGGLAKCKRSSLAISFYKTLAVSGVLGSRSNPFILTILINCYSTVRLGKHAFSAFGLILKNGYCPHICTFNSLIKALFVEKKVAEAACLYSKMIRLGCTPDVFSYSIMIDGLCKTGNVATALQLHRAMVDPKLTTAKESCKPIMSPSGVIGVGCMDQIITDTREKDVRISPDVVSYNCLIDGLCRSGIEEAAKSLFTEMVDHGIHPNVFTYNILINSFFKKDMVEQAVNIVETMIFRNVIPNTVTYNTILDGYCRIGKIEKAKELCLQMKSRSISPNVATYNSLINGLYLSGNGEEAKKFLETMIGDGIFPDVVTFTIIINNLCKEGRLEQAVEVVKLMTQRGELKGFRCV